MHLILKMYYVGLDLSSEDVSLVEVNNMGTWMDLCRAVLSMPIISQDNHNPDVPSSELSLLPEWHCKKWAMAIINRVNGILLS